MMWRPPPRRDPERGATLLLALVFILGVSLVIGGVASLATAAFTTTSNLSQERDLEANAESAATLAIDNERYNYDPNPFSSPSVGSLTPDCMPQAQDGSGPVSYDGLSTYCWGNSYPGSANSRIVHFYVCRTGSAAAVTVAGSFPDPGCSPGSDVLLYAAVTYDDLPPNAPPKADDCTVQPPPNTCGIAMTVDAWDVRMADN
jgi:type II secretory pathway pseudopilin PulG